MCREMVSRKCFFFKFNYILFRFWMNIGNSELFSETIIKTLLFGFRKKTLIKNSILQLIKWNWTSIGHWLCIDVICFQKHNFYTWWWKCETNRQCLYRTELCIHMRSVHGLNKWMLIEKRVMRWCWWKTECHWI